jgi:hypothetical protein
MPDPLEEMLRRSAHQAADSVHIPDLAAVANHRLVASSSGRGPRGRMLVAAGAVALTIAAVASILEVRDTRSNQASNAQVDSVAIISGEWQTGMDAMLALLTVRVVISDEGCLQGIPVNIETADTQKPIALVWPKDYTVSTEEGIEILDVEGRAVVREGMVISMGGGFGGRLGHPCEAKTAGTFFVQQDLHALAK